jgi:hypothetical protein
MPECANCGGIVSAQYARVFTPSDVEQPRACPNCPDKIRDNGTIRDARAPRREAQNS